jgi:phosphate transport system protein
MTAAFQDDPAEGHTAKAFDSALADLRLNAVGMGGLAIDQVGSAVRALLEGNVELAELVLARERNINSLYRRVDREAFELIALHQPMAGDLRLARAISRVAVELERVGDESKKIARFAIRLAQGAQPNEPVSAVAIYLRHMAELSSTMLRQAVRSLDESDPSLAASVAARDVELDREFETAMRQLFTFATEGEKYLRATIDTVFALKGLERIGDHAKNISKQVLFLFPLESQRS